jgi:purine-binding chemotaxis protein CheW
MGEIEQRFLTLSLKGEKYAIPVYRVREILEYAPITRIPSGTACLKGIINVRGRGIPVLDLALRFGFAEAVAAKDTAIVVVELVTGEGRDESAQNGERVVGLIADAVHDVIEVAASLVEEPPRFGSGRVEGFLRGIVRQGEEFVLVLDIDKLLEVEDILAPNEATLEHEQSPANDEADGRTT